MGVRLGHNVYTGRILLACHDFVRYGIVMVGMEEGERSCASGKGGWAEQSPERCRGGCKQCLESVGSCNKEMEVGRSIETIDDAIAEVVTSSASFNLISRLHIKKLLMNPSRYP